MWFVIYNMCVMFLIIRLIGGSTEIRPPTRRQYRFLIFPRGSSLQLVYCLTVPTVNMPNIFVVGATASLAWELPYDPNEPYRKRAELLHRRVDNTAPDKWIMQHTHSNSHSYNYNGLLQKNNHWIKRPIYTTGYHDPKVGNWEDRRYKHQDGRHPMYYSPGYHQVGTNYYAELDEQDYLRSDFDHPIYNEFHRVSRRDLFSRIEKFLNVQKKNGKYCVLRAICEIGKIPDGNGSFMQEVVKRIFRIKKSYFNKTLDEYDLAAQTEDDCSQVYSLCDYS